MDLMAVQEYAQQVAEAISTVIRIDVEIADRNLMRVAGTGRYGNCLGQSMAEEGFVYSEVLRSGKQLVIEKPGWDPLCEPCELKGNCPEKFEVVSPIRVNAEVAGVIGLICFSDTQAKLVEQGRDSYLVFLSKMADTIGLKLKEQELLNGLVSSNRYLNSILDCLDEGILTVDLAGKVLHYNRVMKRFFAGIELDSGTELSALLGPKTAGEIVEVSQKGEFEREVQLDARQNRLQLLVRALPVLTEGGVTSVAVTARPLDEISRMVNRLSGQDASYTLGDILGGSESMRHLRERAKIVAASKSTILIRGESGTGKEMLARAIHNLSPRCQGPFVAINCTAIPEALLESELFGYEDGAFTGARKGGKLGKFELANKGTLFLDEIGDMPLFLQSKILRVLQERQIERIGGLNPIPVDVRVIAATHRDIEQMMAQGEFREDLYYRVNVIPMHIMPLRERKQDLEMLCYHFIRVYNLQFNKNVQSMSEAFRVQLGKYSWPGNVRELQNVIEYAMNLAEGSILDVQHLPARVKMLNQVTRSYKLEDLERETIRICVREYGLTVQGKEKAAAALGIGLATLYRKLARYGLA